MKLKLFLLVLGFAMCNCLPEVKKDVQSIFNILLPSASRNSTPTATLPGSDKVNIAGSVSGVGNGKWVKITLGDLNTTLTENTSFQYFFLSYPKGQEYNIQVAETSEYLSCTIANETGIANEDVNNVNVVCSHNPPLTSYTVGGTVTGLTGSITLSMTGSVPQTKTISANGSYVFDSTLLETYNYNVTISEHSNTSFCFLVNANANHNMNQTGTVGTSNVTNVNIECVGRLTLNEALSKTGGSCTGSDFIEIKNISGASVSSTGWYHCDEGICSTTFNSNSTGMVAFSFGTLANGAYHAVDTSYGLGSNDKVYLVYQSGGKNYLVEQHSWTSHVIPARKYPDGSYDGSIPVTSSQPSWTAGPNTSCTKGNANPNYP